MKLTHIAAVCAASLLMAATGARADVNNLGVLASNGSFDETVTLSLSGNFLNFNETFTFQVAETGTDVNLDFGSFLYQSNTGWLAYDQFSLGGVASSGLAIAGSGNNTFTISGADLVAGQSYSFTISGSRNKNSDPKNVSVVQYGVGYSAVSPVPEPETYALMLAGLGVVGWAARRRKLAASAPLQALPV